MKTYEEYLDQEHRREDRRQRQRLRSVLRRHQSREELRRQRRIAAVCFVVAVISVALAVLVARQALFSVAGGSYCPVEQNADLGPQIASTAVAESVKEEVITGTAVSAPDPDESEKIEAALVCQGYFRDDIPLSYEEQDFLHAAADEFGVDYYIMVALIERETNFRNIPGDGGDSIGYCQIQPKWWSGLMEEIGAEDLTVPRDNFRTACAIVALLTERHGDIENALTAYNRGKPGQSKYATAILTNAEIWRAGYGSSNND